MIVYKFTSPSGKSYIGMTKNTINGRFNQHRYASLKSENKGPFAYALCKYQDVNSWKKEILFESDNSEDIKQKEIECIASHNTLVPNGYNVLQGGQQGLFGMTLSEEHKKKQSEGRKKYYETEEGKQWKQHLSEVYKGNEFSKGLIPYNKGKTGLLKHTDETKKIISDKLTGREFSDEHKKILV
jgi:predicted GIY-YIG superfamily endonuclease